MDEEVYHTITGDPPEIQAIIFAVGAILELVIALAGRYDLFALMIHHYFR
jgi:hypothetical protein